MIDWWKRSMIRVLIKRENKFEWIFLEGEFTSIFAAKLLWSDDKVVNNEPQSGLHFQLTEIT